MNRPAFFLLALALSSASFGKESPGPIPVENQTKGTMPSLAEWQENLKQLIALIEKSDVQGAQAFFFPREAFLQLKAMKGAEAYYDKELIGHFTQDIAKAQTAMQGQIGWEVESFETGRCVWKEKGTEYNDVPYWSCYRNRIHIKNGEKKITLPLRTLINWGPRWYITHLK